MNDDMKKQYFEFLINEYDEGRAQVRGNHPEEVKTAIDTFFKAGKMLVDHPEIGTVPPEYVKNLLKTLAKYPQYLPLVKDLVDIINGDLNE